MDKILFHMKVWWHHQNIYHNQVLYLYKKYSIVIKQGVRPSKKELQRLY